MTAAIYAKRGELKTAILDFGPPGGKMVKTLEIENYSGTGNVQGTDLSMLMFDQTQKLKVSFLNHKVLTVAKRDNYFVVETDGGCYQS